VEKRAGRGEQMQGLVASRPSPFAGKSDSMNSGRIPLSHDCSRPSSEEASGRNVRTVTRWRPGVRGRCTAPYLGGSTWRKRWGARGGWGDRAAESSPQDHIRTSKVVLAVDGEDKLRPVRGRDPRVGPPWPRFGEPRVCLSICVRYHPCGHVERKVASMGKFHTWCRGGKVWPHSLQGGA